MINKEECKERGSVTQIIVLLFLVVIAMFFFVARCGPDPQRVDRTNQRINSTRQKQKSISLAQFKKIEMGMDYKEVRRVLGKEGEEQARNELGGYVTVSYSWKNPDFSNLSVMFQNGKAVSKAQFGLE